MLDVCLLYAGYSCTKDCGIDWYEYEDIDAFWEANCRKYSPPLKEVEVSLTDPTGGQAFLDPHIESITILLGGMN